MTSVHRESSHTTRKFSSTANDGGSSVDDFWGLDDLPVGRRGGFFQDSAFAQERDAFDAAVRSALRRWGDEGDALPQGATDDALRRYRKMRARDLRDDSQAVTVTDDVTCHKIVLDVHDFAEGDVKVKLVGERELVVEGLTGSSKQGFRRSFPLPEMTDIDAIASVMSSDGILTITAPKIVNRAKANAAEDHASSRLTETQRQCECEGLRRKHGGEETTTSTSSTSSSQQERLQRVPIKVCTTSSGSQSSDDRKGSDFATERREASGSTASDTEHLMKGRQGRGGEGEGGGGGTETRTQRSTSTRTESRDSPFSARDSLPIKRKGHYFDDSFFDDTRSHFRKAVNDILREWGEPDLLSDAWDDAGVRSSDALSRYRKMRARKNREDDSQAVTVTDDVTCHKIVLDVHDFAEGDVKVKLVGERELVVEGLTGSSKQGFRRSFPLPEMTDIDAIASVMSSDGILTITAPKIVRRDDSTPPTRVNETVNEQAASQATPSEDSAPAVNYTMADKQEKGRQKEEPLQGPARARSAAKCEAASEAAGSSSEHFFGSREAAEGSASTSSGADEAARDESHRKQENVSSISTQTSFTSVSNAADESHQAEEATRGVLLPIKTRGPFFGDSFFEDSWRDYRDAVKDVVIKWGDFSTGDDMTCYRRLRSRSLRDENQAVRSSEDEVSYKFVVDVQDFLKGGDVTVKALDERELLVEGRVEREEAGGSKSTKTFSRRFVLPEDALTASVSSVMSSDGVLTILAPKKSSNRHGTAEAEPANAQKVEEERREEVRRQTVRTDGEAWSCCPSVRIAKADASLDSSRSSVSTEESFTSSSSRQTSSASSGDNLRASSEAARGQAIPAELEAGGARRGGSEEAWNLDSEEALKEEKKKKSGPEAEGDEEGDGVHRRLEREDCRRRRSIDADQHFQVQFDEKYRNRTLPIATRGPFGDDPFFRDCRVGFRAAVREVLRKARKEEQPPHDDDEAAAAYRSLRRRDLRLENQAVHVDDDDPTWQTIALDVYDFLGGEVTAAVASDGKEVVVEGRAKRREGTSVTTLGFVRRFPLPEGADLPAVGAALASDGVLVVGVPRLRRRRGSSGVDAGRRSLRTTGDDVVRRRRPSEETKARRNDGSSNSSSDDDSDYSSFGRSRRSRRHQHLVPELF